jgi:hypothetical protein
MGADDAIHVPHGYRNLRAIAGSRGAGAPWHSGNVVGEKIAAGPA